MSQPYPIMPFQHDITSTCSHVPYAYSPVFRPTSDAAIRENNYAVHVLYTSYSKQYIILSNTSQGWYIQYYNAPQDAPPRLYRKLLYSGSIYAESYLESL